MDDHLDALLDRLWRDGREFDAARPDRLDRRRNLEPESGALLNLLVRSIAPARVLELGTSTGLSTIWSAEALAGTGGRLLSVDVDAGRLAEAARNLAEAGLGAYVELRLADAADVLERSDPGGWQVIFLDAERPAYVSYWPALQRALAPGGLLVVDNCVSHAGEVREFLDLVAATAGFRLVVVPVGAGLALVSRDR